MMVVYSHENQPAMDLSYIGDDFLGKSCLVHSEKDDDLKISMLTFPVHQTSIT